jgi:hypothetical protein
VGHVGRVAFVDASIALGVLRWNFPLVVGPPLDELREILQQLLLPGDGQKFVGHNGLSLVPRPQAGGEI